ncbi:MAG: DUF6438 domain-containing protein [Bacteroidia bacterium]|nr:DUF6438 domain-containing protein [Bacteroidia bacterium]
MRLYMLGGAAFLWLHVHQCGGRSQPTPKGSATDTLYISVARTGCYGRCPIDKVELLPDGTVRYYGERFVDRVGVYTRRISDKERSELYQLLREGRFEAYKDVYDNPYITDLPSLILHYKMGGQEKKITCRAQCPPDLPDKVEKIRAYLAEQGDFQMIEGPQSDSDAD